MGNPTEHEVKIVKGDFTYVMSVKIDKNHPRPFFLDIEGPYSGVGYAGDTMEATFKYLHVPQDVQAAFLADETFKSVRK